MASEVAGQWSAAGMRLAIVATRTNSLVVDRLVAGAQDAIERCGGDHNTPVVRVAGAFEMPLVAKQVAQSGRVDALVCLGAVIRGQTPHFEYIAGAVSRALSEIQLASAIPVGFGLLTPDSMEQALDRAGGKAGNKGFEAAMAAIETATLIRQLKDQI